ncbi:MULTISPECIES: enoyl-CoA hydratase-related protein [unclassified Bradyrhizobium]|uniref:enoyl-CoA hydratase-related protein n=1 Tax=unclassified Bradyrhizobium TaxID=2631580 RepID=UPI0003F56F45|nr:MULTISPECIES: enoyl-CoA hydratase-related protein [unclassified Bradyrhizobium]QIG92067.1 enoyl-CoA hydratase [Bradyrhizobium sp. 6(2017)]
MSEHVIVNDEEMVRIITMRRPEKKNTLTQDMYLAMSDAIETAQRDPAIRCLILTGRSGVFTAGNDIGDYLQAATATHEIARPRNSVIFLQSLVHNAKPIIAAVDGIAIGIGTTMVFHCDYVVASTTASFSSPFIQYGLVPEGATSLLVPSMVGHQRAFAMLVLGRAMSAADGREAGFVNQIVPPGHAVVEAKKVAREICALPAEAVAMSRKLLRLPTEDLVRRIGEEDRKFGERMRSPEAIAAFQRFFARKKS